MRPIRFSLCAAVAIAGAWFAAPLLAETEDVFAFIPVGGRTLLSDIASSGAPADEVRGLLTGKHTRDEWASYLRDRKAVTALQKLSEKEQLTLADYLSFNMPLPAGQIPADPAKANWAKVLPPDGRDFALDRCQGCHVITVVVTQARSKEAWLGTMNKPSHVRIKLKPEQREALANFLVLNAGIPIDEVPEELRVGGASY
jgi:hypothetical protein